MPPLFFGWRTRSCPLCLIPMGEWEDIMRKPGSVKGLEELGRVRLSKNFFLRDFLYS